jgi:hypothetical protein
MSKAIWTTPYGTVLPFAHSTWCLGPSHGNYQPMMMRSEDKEALTAGATPVWLLGSFAVLSLLYRADISADPAPAAEPSAEQAPASAAGAPSSVHTPSTGAEALTKRAQAERAYARLSATGAPVSAGQLAAAAGLSASYARALVAQFQARTPAAVEQNGGRPAAADADPEAGP